MNKLVRSIVIVAAVAVAFGTTGLVFAQTSTPPADVPGTGYGAGIGGGRGARGGMMQAAGNQVGLMGAAAGTQDGILHDALIAAYAGKLGISVDDLNARLAGGETLAAIAFAQGLSLDEFQVLKADARSQAIDQAVTDGTLTQEQADWMKQHGAGVAAGGRGMRGTGQGQFANPDCPYYQTTP